MYFLSSDVIRYTIPPSHEKEFYNRFTFIKTEIVIGTTPIPAFLPLDGHDIIGISKKKMDLKYVKSNLFRVAANSYNYVVKFLTAFPDQPYNE